ncbi:hypothetical protein EMPS_02655 [Entomortierella parvispora]|uniref:Skg3/CAF120-like PH-like domain-containing protein n=1 Tax=Entomortierella parvispora TaxID=205924 RepID=A0A9P3H565_9FUNG|nr:hypothetical protein EMPS_02655 [Entomortierella parvispora]
MAAVDIHTEWRSGEMMDQKQQQQHSLPSSLLPALPVDGKRAGNTTPHHSDSEDRNGIDAAVEGLGIGSPASIPASLTSRSSSGISYPSPPPANLHSRPSTDPHQSRSPPPQQALFTENRQNSQQQQQQQQQQRPMESRMRAGVPNPLQIPSLASRTVGSGPNSAGFAHSPLSTCDSPVSSLSVQQPWMQHPGTASPRHGPLLTPGHSSPSLTPHLTMTPRQGSSNSLPLPGTWTPSSRKNSVASLQGGLAPAPSSPALGPRASPGFRGAPLGQTSDTESVLKQFDVYFGKVYIKGQLQKKAECGLDGFKLHGQQWAAYNVELVGRTLRIVPMPGASGSGGVAEEMNMEEARVEMQEGPNGGTFTINWMGANKAVFQPVQQLSLGAPEVGSTCQDWVCAIRLSCYECSRLQEIYTSTLLRRPKFRDQVAASIEGPVKHEGMLRVRFWAGEEWLRLWVVVSDQRGGEEIKKKKQGKVLQATPIRGQIHFYEGPKSKRPFVSMYNVSQAYAVCPSRSSLNSSKDSKVDEEGSLTIKLEGDVVLQRENLSSPRKGFFSSPSPPSAMARDLQALLPTGRSMFCMIQVPNAVERTKLLLGTSEAFRIYGKPGPLLFDSPTDPAAMNFGCMASSLLQQELLIGLDAVLHLPQKGESLADVKFSFGEVLRKRLIAENPPPPPPPFSRERRFSNQSAQGGRRQVSMVFDNGMCPPSPMMAMAMRSRANSGSGYLVPLPSPGLHPAGHMSMYGAPHSPSMGPYAGISPRQGPLHASPYHQHLQRATYAPSNTSTDENDANLITDEEGEDDEYPDSPEDEEDPNGLNTPFRSRAGSLMAPPPNGYSQVRKGSLGGMNMQGMALPNGSRQGRSASFTSAYGVQVMAPAAPTPAAGSNAASATAAALELPSLDSFADDFGIRQSQNKDSKKKLTAVVYPTQIVIPKNKKKDLSANTTTTLSSASVSASTGGLASASSLNPPSPLSSVAPISPSIKVNGEESPEERDE